MAATPYLYFDGSAAEAFERYREVFGGELQTLPYEQMGEGAPPGSEGRLLHAYLEGRYVTLLGSDELDPPGTLGESRRVAVSVDVADLGEAKRIFDQLAEGGVVVQEQIETFFANTWGIVQDRWGQRWMISVFKSGPDHSG